ncbi:MAG: SH3 domain-containing protein [bacterium]|nr:SH3 domain-containing protein [bacterium]
MKKQTSLFIIAALLFLAMFTAYAQGVMSVQVKETPLRSSPNFLGKVVAKVAYTEQVEVIEEQAGWSEVNVISSGQNGWIHSSALTSKTIILNPGIDDIERAASSDEIALAGKGFGPEVEEQYKQDNSGANYVVVDTMEKVVVSEQQMIKFLEAGGISSGEGGAE